MHVGKNFRIPRRFHPKSISRSGSSTQAHSVGRRTDQALLTDILTMPRASSSDRSFCLSDVPESMRKASRKRQGPLSVTDSNLGGRVYGSSLLWSLLPLVVRVEMQLGATAHGVLLTCIGLGAVLRAALLSRLRKSMSIYALVACTSIVVASSASALAFTSSFLVSCNILLAADLA